MGGMAEDSTERPGTPYELRVHGCVSYDARRRRAQFAWGWARWRPAKHGWHIEAHAHEGGLVTWTTQHYPQVRDLALLHQGLLSGGDLTPDQRDAFAVEAVEIAGRGIPPDLPRMSGLWEDWRRLQVEADEEDARARRLRLVPDEP